MRISDWSSDVCSSDLLTSCVPRTRRRGVLYSSVRLRTCSSGRDAAISAALQGGRAGRGIALDRKRVAEGKSGSVRVDLGGSRIITKKNTIDGSHACYAQRILLIITDTQIKTIT